MPRLIDADDAHIYLNATACEQIKSMPTVDPESLRPHGTWSTRKTDIHDGEPYCTVCDYEPQIGDKTNFCPNCGAKMDLEG